MGKYLGENSQYFKKLFIAAHTDERGSKERNLELSKTRADLVRDFLVEGGAPAGKIQTQGFGESKPIDKRHTEKAWAKNRRVELKFSGVSDSKIIKKALDQ
jgi:peptidoglycan-associated lipoprotein